MGKRVVVVGGGVVGLCSALYLTRDGHEVVVVDRGQPDGDRCSMGNSGLIVPSHFVPLAAPGMVAMGMRMMVNPQGPFRIKPSLDPGLARWMWLFARSATSEHVKRSAPILKELSLMSRTLFLQLAQEADFGLVQNGLLAVCRTAAGLEHEAKTAEQARSLGLQAEVLDRAQLAKADPGFPYMAEGAVFFPEDCHLDPPRLMAALRDLNQQAGTRFEWGREAENFSENKLETSGGPIEGDAFVLAGGAWSPLMSRSLGVAMPMQAGKGYSLTLGTSTACPSVPSLLIEDRLALTPMGSGFRIGGTMEIVGLDLSVDGRRVAGIVDSFVRGCSGVSRSEVVAVKPWSGLRPVSPDGMPYVGAFSKFPNVFAATGHAMLGVSLGPVTGRIAADWASGRGSAPEALNPERFG